MTISWSRTLRRFSVIALGAVVVGVLAPGAAVPSAKDAVVAWSAPTPAEGTVIGVAAKTQVSIQLAGGSSVPAVMARIREGEGSPEHATLHMKDGNQASATFVWKPAKADIGTHQVTFTVATDTAGSDTRTVVIRVGKANHAPPGPAAALPGVYPKSYLFSDRQKETYRWAFVRHATVARSGPSSGSHAMSRITFRTPELYRNAIQVLDGVKYRNHKTWVRIRLAILPNSSTGWVPKGSLERFSKVHTRMVISHARLRATLYKRGRPIFSSIIGVGQPSYPTPRGDFYIREKLSGYYAPAYGPRAFGLNARSAVLTDWPGGGFVGIHGTNAPQMLPGRVSHGCVRMRNDAIMRLFRLMPIGTPVHIS
jgi:lipoprotein-anchoring transpeptidase ErfK/SrfK